MAERPRVHAEMSFGAVSCCGLAQNLETAVTDFKENHVHSPLMSVLSEQKVHERKCVSLMSRRQVDPMVYQVGY